MTGSGLLAHAVEGEGEPLLHDEAYYTLHVIPDAGAAGRSTP